VPAHEVRLELRKFIDDLRAWVEADSATAEPDLGVIARVIADGHHRSNGFTRSVTRTGEQDASSIMACCGRRSHSRATRPRTRPSPNISQMQPQRNDYFDGLAEADLGRPERFRRFYAARLEATLARSPERRPGPTRCPVHEPRNPAVKFRRSYESLRGGGTGNRTLDEWLVWPKNRHSDVEGRDPSYRWFRGVP